MSETRAAKATPNTPLSRTASGFEKPGKCMACCIKFFKALMITMNFIFLIFGCILAGIAGWALSNEGALASLVPKAGLTLALIAAFVLATVSCIGMYAALDENRLMLRLYVGIALATICIEVAAGAVVFQFLSDLDGAKNKVESSFDQRVFNAINETYCDCCNITVAAYGCNIAGGRVTDAANPICKILPSSFKVGGDDCSDASGYQEALINWIETHLRPIAIVCLIWTVPQVIAFVSACLLSCRKRLSIGDKHADDTDYELPAIHPREPEAEVEYWPFVLVFPVEKKQKKKRKWPIKRILKRLKDADLRYCLFHAADKKSIFCKVSASRARLEAEANRIDFKLRLDPEELRKMDVRMNQKTRREGDRVMENGSLEIAESAPIYNCGKRDENFYPYHYIHFEYDSLPDARQRSTMSSAAIRLCEERQRLYLRDRFSRMKFREIDVIKLIWSILEGPAKGAVPRGAGLALDHMFHAGEIEEYFPLHHPTMRGRLKSMWYKWLSNPWWHPTHRIRGYFGEKIAMYFSFMSHFTQWLLAPAFIGVIVYVHQRAADDVSVPELPLFAVFIALWATLFLEAWKRKRATNVMIWGMQGYEHNEETRPQYNEIAKQAPSPIDGLPARFYSNFYYRSKIVISTLAIAVMIAIVLVAVMSIFLLRAILVSAQEEGHIPDGTAGYIAAFVNAIQIHILNSVYAMVARKLNDWENHATDTIYEDNLIAKTFCFQFINSYFNLFYVAFIKNNVTLAGREQACAPNDNGVPDCLQDLSNQLGTIFVTRLVIGNLTEFIVPWLTTKIAACRTKRDSNKNQRQMSRAEKENDLLDYETFADYSETVIQFGYVTLFVVAFPLAPLLAFVNNYVEMRVDALKLLDRCCRPEPRGAEDIGTWYPILEILGIVAVMTNMAAVIFSTSNPAFDVTDKLWMVWMWVLFEHGVFALKYLLGKFVPDIPSHVALQLDRQKYLTAKHMLGETDDIVLAADVRVELEGDIESKRQGAEDAFVIHEEDPFPWPDHAGGNLVATMNVLHHRAKRGSIGGAPETKVDG